MPKNKLILQQYTGTRNINIFKISSHDLWPGRLSKHLASFSGTN